MSNTRFILVSILTGFLLNLSGWLGNNFVLKDMWNEVALSIPNTEWRNTIWRDIFSFVPDYIYGFAIVWLIVILNRSTGIRTSNSLKSGFFISLVGGITAYFGIANSGFINWELAIASFGLVLLTKVPLALLAGKLLYTKK